MIVIKCDRTKVMLFFLFLFVLFWAVIHFPFDMALMSNKVKLKTYSEVVVCVHVVYCARSSLILLSSLVSSSVCAVLSIYRFEEYATSQSNNKLEKLHSRLFVFPM